MRFRQVHLDFHTSEAIDGIGSQFSASQFQEMLKVGHVDSITVFSKCHHGWAYHPSKASKIHPGLSFDLLAAQIDAAHAIGVNTPVYLSAGLDERQAREHPEWLLRNKEDKSGWTDSWLRAGYHLFCMNSPYLHSLVAQIEEVVQNYDCDGIFLDIVGVHPCLCHSCLAQIRAEGTDPLDDAVVLELAERTYANYTRRTNEAVHKHKPGLPVFHNGGHIKRGRRDLAAMNTHIELESLPTGGWGYDHLPLSARYVANLGLDYLAMTGKFHTTWGEFGGYKHPNALRYEAALNLANGAKMSIGDQLHPLGLMDPATYALIGAAFAEVEAKEQWCENVKNIADVALLSAEAAGLAIDDATNTGDIDAGAVRILLEGGYLFDVVDFEQDLAPYKVVVLPDKIRVDNALKSKLDAYTAGGGKLFATGESGLNEAGNSFAIDLGVTYIAPSQFKPNYFRPSWEVKNLGIASFVFYSQGQTVLANESASVLGIVKNPYFNRAYNHFSSHQHTPNEPKAVGPGMIESAHGIYLAWNVFEDYANKGSLILKESVVYALDRLLGQRKTVSTNLPAQGVTTLTWQGGKSRYVHHLLYASPVKRGKDVEVIEDIIPLHNIEAAVRVGHPIKRVVLQPEGVVLPFVAEGGVVTYTVPKVEGHQMVVLEC